MVDWLLVRARSAGPRTWGTLYDRADAMRVLCITLEDAIRERPGVPVSAWKVYGQTAIPAGRYALRLFWWAKHGVWVPHVEGVPGYTGILMHGGVTEADTLGCPLVGFAREGDRLTGGRLARALVADRLRAAGGSGWLEVVNPAVVAA